MLIVIKHLKGYFMIICNKQHKTNYYYSIFTFFFILSCFSICSAELVNQPPVFTFNKNKIILKEDFLETITILVEPSPVSEGEEEQTITYSIEPTQINFASVSINSENGIISISSVPNGNGALTCTVVANDGQSYSNTFSQNFELIVEPVNDIPKFSLDKTILVLDEDFTGEQQITLTTSNVPFDEIEQDVFYSLKPPNVNLVDIAIDSKTGHIRISSKADQNGRQKFLITANDHQSENNIAEEFIFITINEVNDPPEFKIDQESITVDEDLYLTQTIHVEQKPVPANELDQIVTYSLIPESIDFAKVSIDSLSGTVQIIPVPNKYGFQSFIVMANDGQNFNYTATACFSITVNEMNDQPIAYTEHQEILAETRTEITLKSFDQEQSLLLYELTDWPKNGFLIYQSSKVIYKPKNCFTGKDSFSFRVYDGLLFSKEATIFLDITLNPPIIGDINRNDLIELNDAILALWNLTGIKSCCNWSDVNEDNKIGTEDLIYILTTISKQ
jgi:hypothetical protein